MTDGSFVLCEGELLDGIFRVSCLEGSGFTSCLTTFERAENMMRFWMILTTLMILVLQVIWRGTREPGKRKCISFAPTNLEVCELHPLKAIPRQAPWGFAPIVPSWITEVYLLNCSEALNIQHWLWLKLPVVQNIVGASNLTLPMLWFSEAAEAVIRTASAHVGT